MRSIFICKRWEVFGDSDVSLVSAAVCCRGLKPHVSHRLGYIADDLTYGPTLELPFDSREIFKNTWLQRKHCIFGIHIQRTNILGSWRDYLVMICERDLRFIVDCSPDVGPWLAVEWFAVLGKEPHLSPPLKIFTSVPCTQNHPLIWESEVCRKNVTWNLWENRRIWFVVNPARAW